MPKAMFVLEWHDSEHYEPHPNSLEDPVGESWKEIKSAVEDAVFAKFSETNGINYCYDVEFYELS